jgi:hypothetical protein
MLPSRMWKKPGQPTGKYRDWDEIEGKRAGKGPRR